MPTDDITSNHNTAASRYEIHLAGALAGYAEYQQQDGVVTFTHTQVLPAYEGKGIGSRLAKFALDDVRQNGRRAVAACEFIAAYVSRHPEYQDLMAA